MTTSTKALRPISRTCPPFDSLRFERQLRLDDSARWIIFIALGLCITLASLWGPRGTNLAVSLMILIITIAWVSAYISSARVTHQISHLTELMVFDLPAAESMLASAMTRLPLQRPVRLLLYHRLAKLRHTQNHLAESGAICRAILAQRHGVTQQLRAHLLLMLVESQLYLRDLWGAHTSLMELHRLSLNLMETLHRMAIQMRYEILSGQYQAALDQIDRKIQLSELLPANECGAFHLMLATAAQETSKTQLAQWLRARAALLCSTDQIHLSTNSPRTTA